LLLSDWDKQASFEGFVKSTTGIVMLGAIKTLGQSTRIKWGNDAIWEGVETLMQLRQKT
jgi:biotin-(acetyl-CoA carboxylase) ligase